MAVLTLLVPFVMSEKKKTIIEQDDSYTKQHNTSYSASLSIEYSEFLNRTVKVLLSHTYTPRQKKKKNH